jgi:hypothetical protein
MALAFGLSAIQQQVAEKVSSREKERFIQRKFIKYGQTAKARLHFAKDLPMSLGNCAFLPRLYALTNLRFCTFAEN